MGVLVAASPVQDAAQQQQLWSEAANAAKRSILLWRATTLALVLAGAVIATLATQLANVPTPLGRLLSIGSGIAVGFVPVIRSFRLSSDRLRDWTRLRSVSEGIKSEMYHYLARVRPYADHDAEQRLLTAITGIADNAKDLQGRLLGLSHVEASIPTVTDAPSYITQ